MKSYSWFLQTILTVYLGRWGKLDRGDKILPWIKYTEVCAGLVFGVVLVPEDGAAGMVPVRNSAKSSPGSSLALPLAKAEQISAPINI